MKDRKGRKPHRKPLSPVVAVRHISSLARLLLFVQAGGCEFDGCPHYLIEHPVTLTEGNFAQVAHIVAFRKDGPRGRVRSRPKNIHALHNLMLLCPQCHKLIDDKPEQFTRRTLSEYKRRHERWIKQATGLSPNRKTALLVFIAPIGRQIAAISYDQMLEAVAPRYPVSREGVEIDLTNLIEESADVIAVAKQTIALAWPGTLSRTESGRELGNVSVFALGPMPLLFFLGSQLTNKVSTDLYQRHRDKETWRWTKSGRSVKYK